MSDVPLGRPLDGETPDDLQAIAAAVFASHGVDFATVRRAGGWTNAVWLADTSVLRLCTTRETERLQREAQLAALFPPGVGYPAILDTGTTGGHAWMLAARLPGRCLGDVWESLSWDERVTALQDLWERAQAVHSVPPAGAATIAASRAWFNSNDATEAKGGPLPADGGEYPDPCRAPRPAERARPLLGGPPGRPVRPLPRGHDA